MALTGAELNKRQRQKANQLKEARLQIVSELWLKGWSCRRIAEEATKRLQTEKPINQSTIKRDKDLLLKQWHEDNMGNVEDWVQLELARIDECILELWKEWDKSKQDTTRQEAQKEEVMLAGKEGSDGKGGKPTKLPVTKTKQKQSLVQGMGNVAYIVEIRQQLMERRKLLGLYKPDKQELTGKDGAPLNPAPQTSTPINMEELTEEELELLYKIAQKRDKKAQEQ